MNDGPAFVYVDRSPSEKISIEPYKILRSYIDEENKLLNYRMTWLLAINGFLFASYAFVVRKKLETPNSPMADINLPYLPTFQTPLSSFSIMLTFICVLGLFICMSAMPGIRGARRSVTYIEKFTTNHYALYPMEDDSLPASRSLLSQIISEIILAKMIVIPIWWALRRPKILNRFAFPREDLRYISCLKINESEYLPFITGGGFYNARRKTKMASMKFNFYLIWSWITLFAYSIFVP